jgi:beta-mannosidase
VHTDLLAAGLIPDPYLDTNELSLDWIGRAEWIYERDLPRLPAADALAPALAFDGLDTVASISVDGVEIGRTANQHRRYEFALGSALDVAGPHRLAVTLHSAWDHAQEREARLGAMPNAYPAPFPHIRKSACNFGWDWGPTLVTAGIWRSARLLGTAPRLADVEVTATVEDAHGAVRIEARSSAARRLRTSSAPGRPSRCAWSWTPPGCGGPGVWARSRCTTCGCNCVIRTGAS